MAGRSGARSKVSRISGLDCIGSICFDKDGTIVVEPTKDSCPVDFQKKLINSVFQGKKVEFKMPKNEE